MAFRKKTKTMIETKICDKTYQKVWRTISPQTYQTSLINIKIASQSFDLGILAKKAIQEQLRVE